MRSDKCRFRITSIMIAVVMVISTLIALTPNTSGYNLVPNGAMSVNTTGLTGKTVSFFNYTFEHEKLGTRPDFAHAQYSDAPNMTVRAVQDATWRNQVIKINRSGESLGLYRTWFSIGHDLEGVFYLDYDFYWNKSAGVDYNQIVMIEEYGGSTYALKMEFTHSAKFKFAGTSYSSITMKTWHHVHVEFNTTNQSAMGWLDNVYLKTAAFNTFAASLSAWEWNIQAMPAGVITEVYYDNIDWSVPEHYAQPYPIGSDERTAISFTFDDCLNNTYSSAFADLGSLPGSISVITSLVGTSGTYATWAELQDLANHGWEILSHSVTHPAMTGLSETQQRYEYQKSKEWIEANLTGVDVLGWIYPGEARNNASNLVGWEYYEYLDSPGFDFGRSLITNNDLYKYQAFLPPLVYGRFGYIHFYTHSLNIPGDASNANRTHFQYLVDHLIENNSRVVTLSQWVREHRNFYNVQIVGNANSFILQYNETYQNYAMSDVSVQIAGFEDNARYRILKDGDEVDQAYGPVLSFIASGPGQYEVKYFLSSGLSALVDVTFIMLGVGIIVGVCGETVNSFRKRSIPDEEMTKRLLIMVVYIIIGLALLGVIYASFS